MWDELVVSRCPECGADPGSDARFCRSCGAPVRAASTDDQPAARDGLSAPGQFGLPPASPSYPASQADTARLGYAGYPGYGGRPPRRRRAGVIVASVIALVVLVAGGAVAVLASRHTPGPASAVSASTGPVSPTPASATPEQQAATRLAALLGISATDRGLTGHAYLDVLTCSPALSQDVAAFQQAATSEKQLVTRLASLPGASALPVPMTALLTGAWQQSALADQNFVAWADDENSGTCTPDDTADGSLQAGGALQIAADALKAQFVRQWNPLAARYGLPAYQASQI
jgi:hypothetical protein